MNRRAFMAQAGAALTGAALASVMPTWAQSSPDVKLEIAPLALEIAPGKTVHTVAYNGRVPGPLIRWPEGKPIVIDVVNRTTIPEIVHWHGLWIPSDMDGSAEEGGAMIAPGGQFRYVFTPQPAGFRWYHTHTFAGHDLRRSTYSGQFGCFYIEPKNDAGAYDQEVFLTLHDWNGYMANSGDSSMEPAYDYGTIDGRMLGFSEPLKVREGQRVLLHLLNASASLIHWLALSGHELTVVAMDGNPVPTPGPVRAVRLGPAERIDVVVAMNQPGVWILGETRDQLRKTGMGIVVEYANQEGKPKWVEPAETLWDYRAFAAGQPATTGAATGAATRKPDEIIPLRFESKFHGPGAFDSWTINGKSYPDTDTIMLRQGQRYRLQMINRSTDDHPLHLHRHTFEVTSLEGKPLSGLNKDVVVVPGKSNPGATLFHCHNQTHMDFGFMTLFQYA